MTTHQSEPLPCPFCGHIPAVVKHIFDGFNLCHRPSEERPRRECILGSIYQSGSDRETRVAAWNKRWVITLPRSAMSVTSSNQERHYLNTSDVIKMLDAAGISWQWPFPEKTPEPVQTITIWPDTPKENKENPSKNYVELEKGCAP